MSSVGIMRNTDRALDAFDVTEDFDECMRVQRGRGMVWHGVIIMGRSAHVWEGNRGKR